MCSLTIAIPTYNRKNRLVNQLKSIFSQEESQEVTILVIDNNSPYDVKTVIKDEFGDRTNIKVIVNRCNIGGDGNIASTFYHCKTKWMWLLGDDDETLPGSISAILSDINHNPDVVFFKYSIKDFKKHENAKLHSMGEFIDYYVNGEYSGGDMIFMSNNVFNMELIRLSLGDTLTKSFCRIPHLLAVFNFFLQRSGVMCVRSYPIVSYKKPEKGTSWNMLTISVGIATLPLVDLGLDDIHYKRMMNKIGSGFPHGKIARLCLNMENRHQAYWIYHHIYNSIYKFTNRFYDKKMYLIFHILYYLRIKVHVN